MDIYEKILGEMRREYGIINLSARRRHSEGIICKTGNYLYGSTGYIMKSNSNMGQAAWLWKERVLYEE